MRDTVVVMGVGGPAGLNVARAAKHAGYRVFGFDTKPDMLPLAELECESAFVMPDVPVGVGKANGAPILCQPEEPLPRLAELRDEGLVNWHGPRTESLDGFRDKWVSSTLLYAHGLRRSVPVGMADELPDHLHLAKDKFGLPFWLRLREGAGASGAILVEDLRAAYHWIRLHNVQFGTLPFQFIAEEYLPGRDFCWTGLFHEGELVASFARERHGWIYPRLAPFSGRTGTPTKATVVCDKRVNAVALKTVEVLDGEPHGVYCVDMREDEKGYPRPTEVNAGRWATTSPIYSLYGPNLVAAQIRLANGDSVHQYGVDCYPEGLDLLRHIDMGNLFCLDLSHLG